LDADWDATRRDATKRKLELSGDFITLVETLTELDCPDATLRLKSTELGATRDWDADLDSLTPMLLPAAYA
jgi:hypothetical protein